MQIIYDVFLKINSDLHYTSFEIIEVLKIMNSVNYKHLRYFWAVARRGGIVHAAKLLHVTPQTVRLADWRAI